MSDLGVTHTFNAGDVVSAAKFNTNYTTDIAGYINNRNSGSASWDFFYVTRSSDVPLTVNNSTGAFSVAQFNDNGTTVLEVHDAGIVTTAKQSGVVVDKVSQSITSGSITAMTLDPVSVSYEFDVQSELNTSLTPGRITVLKGGKYIVAFTPLLICDDTSVIFTGYIYKNGSEFSQFIIIPRSISGSINNTYVFQDIMSLSAGDYIEFYARLQNFSGLVGSVGALQSVMFMHKLS